jgi:hypothetical protein
MQQQAPLGIEGARQRALPRKIAPQGGINRFRQFGADCQLAVQGFKRQRRWYRSFNEMSRVLSGIMQQYQQLITQPHVGGIQ